MKAADLRARREACGLTQDDLSAIVGVQTRTVNRWERGTSPVPEDVAELIRRIEGSRARIVEQAERAVVSNDRGGKVQLTYYRTQEQFDELGRDGGPFGVANANARAVAMHLELMGYEVEFAYPDDADNVYHS